MQNEYEESFYYDKSGSTGDAVAGEVIGAGIGLGVGGISMILAAVTFLFCRFDLLSSGLLAAVFYVITCRQGWGNSVYFCGIAGIILISMILQHSFKAARIVYGIFTCVVVSLFGTVFLGYDSKWKMYLIMLACFSGPALWGVVSWNSIMDHQDRN